MRPRLPPLGVPVNDYLDADLHVIWTVLAGSPLTHVLREEPFAVGGAAGVGGWMLNPEKVAVAESPAVFLEFRPNPPHDPRDSRNYNAVQWFDAQNVFRTVQGFGSQQDLLRVATSLA